MARPTKKGLEYFPLDCHMSDEVNLIIADFGIEGYGVLISMFQSIYGDKGYYTEWTTREQKLFSRKVGLDNEIVVNIITECIEWGIFNKSKFEELNILTSRRIQDHYATSTYKRTNVIMDEKYLIIDISDKKHINNVVTDDGNSPTTIVTVGKSTQSKVKYSNSKEKTYRKFKHLSLSECEKDRIIEFGYSINQLDSILDSIENYSKNKNYTSLNLTARKWLKKEYGEPSKNVKTVKEDIPQWVKDKLEGEQ